MKTLIATLMTLALLAGGPAYAGAHLGHIHDDHADHEDRDDEHEDHDGHDDHGDHDGHDGHDGDKDDHAGHSDEYEEGNAVSLSAEQRRLAGIEVSRLMPEYVDYEVYAPGEIKANGYRSYIASPRTDSIVLTRHAQLGDHVEPGQPLVTLFSETVAEAQAAHLVAAAEWQRVRRLGRQAVGDKRYLEARANFENTEGRLVAFGLSESAIAEIAANTNSDLGAYTLTAAIEGVVLSDDFQQGQRVEAGNALFELADESELWVEARLSPGETLRLEAGTEAFIVVKNNRYPAAVAQEAHTIDPVTRTRVVRLIVANESHQLHSGMFADVFFSFATSSPVLSVPQEALMRDSHGDWTVFKETDEGLVPTEVELGRSLGSLQEISGIEPGTPVVTRGAFFVASQIAKGGFDPHDH